MNGRARGLRARLVVVLGEAAEIEPGGGTLTLVRRIQAGSGSKERVRATPSQGRDTTQTVFRARLPRTPGFMSPTRPSRFVRVLATWVAIAPVADMVAAFPRREIWILNGMEDNEGRPDLDTSCPASLQGGNRLERGRRYYEYLGHFFGPDVYESKFIDRRCFATLVKLRRKPNLCRGWLPGHALRWRTSRART